MSKRKPMDKAQARERRNRLLESAAAADLSLTEGVREMRAIAGMTQEEFARHREVSARVIKAIELGQGNPTVATLNRIGQFFGLEVGFVPVRRAPATGGKPQHAYISAEAPAPAFLNDSGALGANTWNKENYRELAQLIAREIIQNSADAFAIPNRLPESPEALGHQPGRGEPVQKTAEDAAGSRPSNDPLQEHASEEPALRDAPVRRKRKTRSP
jgi:DNA-binding XRE family transcriptional regulator